MDYPLNDRNEYFPDIIIYKFTLSSKYVLFSISFQLNI